MISEIVLSAIGGFLSKACDEQSEQGLPYPTVLFYAAALAYGATLGWLSVFTPLSALFLALAVAAILCGKIDHPIHVLGMTAFVAVLIFYPMAQFDPWAFSLFLVAGLLDELELRLGRVLMLVGEQRLWTPLAALALMLYGGQYIFFVAIIAFDLAYRLARWLIETRVGGPWPAFGNARVESGRTRKTEARRRR